MVIKKDPSADLPVGIVVQQSISSDPEVSKDIDRILQDPEKFVNGIREESRRKTQARIERIKADAFKEAQEKSAKKRSTRNRLTRFLQGMLTLFLIRLRSNR